jgi:hypothetical protein
MCLVRPADNLESFPRQLLHAHARTGPGRRREVTTSGRRGGLLVSCATGSAPVRAACPRPASFLSGLVLSSFRRWVGQRRGVELGCSSVRLYFTNCTGFSISPCDTLTTLDQDGPLGHIQMWISRIPPLSHVQDTACSWATTGAGSCSPRMSQAYLLLCSFSPRLGVASLSVFVNDVSRNSTWVESSIIPVCRAPVFTLIPSANSRFPGPKGSRE